MSFLLHVTDSIWQSLACHQDKCTLFPLNWIFDTAVLSPFHSGNHVQLIDFKQHQVKNTNPICILLLQNIFYQENVAAEVNSLELKHFSWAKFQRIICYILKKKNKSFLLYNGIMSVDLIDGLSFFLNFMFLVWCNKIKYALFNILNKMVLVYICWIFLYFLRCFLEVPHKLPSS